MHNIANQVILGWQDLVSFPYSMTSSDVNQWSQGVRRAKPQASPQRLECGVHNMSQQLVYAIQNRNQQLEHD